VITRVLWSLLRILVLIGLLWLLQQWAAPFLASQR
jgi:hypothetical protein